MEAELNSKRCDAAQGSVCCVSICTAEPFFISRYPRTHRSTSASLHPCPEEAGSTNVSPPGGQTIEERQSLSNKQ